MVRVCPKHSSLCLFSETSCFRGCSAKEIRRNLAANSHLRYKKPADVRPRRSWTECREKAHSFAHRIVSYWNWVCQKQMWNIGLVGALLPLFGKLMCVSYIIIFLSCIFLESCSRKRSPLFDCVFLWWGHLYMYVKRFKCDLKDCKDIYFSRESEL